MFREFQHNSESKRLELEKQLNQYMKSDHRLARLKAVRLQNYWKKLCEDEKRSQWRNEAVNEGYWTGWKSDDIPCQLGRIIWKLWKRQYEEYIERVYPQWKEKVMAYQEMKKQAQLDVEKNYTAAALSLKQGSAMPGTEFTVTSTPLVNKQVISQQHMADTFSPGVRQTSLQYPRTQFDINDQQAFINQQLLQQQHQQLYQQRQHLYHQQQQHQNNSQQSEVPQIRVIDPSDAGGGTPRVCPGSTVQTVSDLPTGYTLTSNIQQQQQVPYGTLDSTPFSTAEHGMLLGAYEDRPIAHEPDHQSTDDHSTSHKVTSVQHSNSSSSRDASRIWYLEKWGPAVKNTQGRAKGSRCQCTTSSWRRFSRY